MSFVILLVVLSLLIWVVSLKSRDEGVNAKAYGTQMRYAWEDVRRLLRNHFPPSHLERGFELEARATRIFEHYLTWVPTQLDVVRDLGPDVPLPGSDDAKLRVLALRVWKVRLARYVKGVRDHFPLLERDIDEGLRELARYLDEHAREQKLVLSLVWDEEFEPQALLEGPEEDVEEDVEEDAEEDAEEESLSRGEEEMMAWLSEIAAKISERDRVSIDEDEEYDRLWWEDPTNYM